MKILLIGLVILFYSQISNAEPKLFSSDWPVWNITEGMHKRGLLDSFDYQYKKYDASLKWFKAGNLDITFMTLYDFISIQPTKVPTVIIGITDYSNGGDKIIFRKNIKKPIDLQGKKILLESNTISLWMLQNYLAFHGLGLDGITIVNQKNNLAPLQFKEDLSFSAVIGWNPNIDKALDESSYVAGTSADFPRVIYDLIVAKQSVVKEFPRKIDQFKENFYQSINNDLIINETSNSLSVSSDEYKSWLKDAYIFSSQKAAIMEYEYLVENAKKIRQFLTYPPKSLNEQEAKKRFKPRNINIQNLIKLKSGNQ